MQNLDSVVECYYRPGQEESQSFAGRYDFLSAEATAQVPRERWKEIQAEQDPAYRTNSVAQLGTKRTNNRTFARVSLTVTDVWKERECKRVRTHTWVQEPKGWRRQFLPVNSEHVSAAMASGDYTATAELAEEWLEQDPFSIAAYKKLLFAISRGGAGDGSRRSRDDILRAVLAINENDSTALFLSASFASNLSVGKAFLNQLSRDDCTWHSAARNVAHDHRDLKGRLQFIDSLGSLNTTLVALKLVTLSELRRHKEFLSLHAEYGVDQLTTDYLDSEDPSFAAANAALLGLGCQQAGDTGSALRWLNYAVRKDPNNRTVIQLAKELE